MKKFVFLLLMLSTLTITKLCYGNVIFSENFDNVTTPNLPAGWLVIDVLGNDGEWYTSNATHHPSGNLPKSQPNLVYFNSWHAPSSMTRLYYNNHVSLPLGQGIKLNFWMYHDTGFNSFADALQVQISYDKTNWINVGDLIYRYDGSSGWKKHTVDLSSYANQNIYIGFLGISAYGNDIHLDDIEIVFDYLANLPKTGQTKCFNSSGQEISCSGTGQDGEMKAGKSWPNPRFQDNGDGTITDKLTGLMWLKDANCMATNYPEFDNDNQSGDGNVTWYHAIDFVNGINNGAYSNCGSGYTDWRLPNIYELRSILNFGYNEGGYLSNSDWLLSSGFTNVGSTYWSSTTSSFSIDMAWFVDFAYAYDNPFYKDYAYYKVLPVRGGQQNNPDFTYPINIPKTGQMSSYYLGDDGTYQYGVSWPNPRFQDNGDGTITDNLTGLTWLKDANCMKNNYPEFDNDDVAGDGKVTWDSALNFLNGINSGLYPNCGAGYNDWRLPNILEISSLYNLGYNFSDCEGSCTSNFKWLQMAGFYMDYTASYYWSSTTQSYYKSEAFIFEMYEGYIGSYGPKYNKNFVWPVRGGSFTLNLAKSGSGTGIIISSDNKINCGTDCLEDYLSGSQVILTAEPGENTIFYGWSGDCVSCGNSITCQVNINTTKTCVAIFNANQHLLTIIQQGTGSGKVTSSPEGINCGSDCDETYTYGAQVTLTATPDPDSEFESWTGDCSGSNYNTTITMEANKTCTANFKKVITINNGSKYTTNASVILTLEPVGSPTKMTIYNGKTWSPEESYTSQKAISVTGGDGRKDIYVRLLIDGIWKEYRDYIYFDAKTPVGGVQINNGSPITNNPTVTLNLYVADYQDTSNIQMNISEDKVNWTGWISFDTPFTYTFSNTNEGIKTIYVQYRDSGGKTSPIYSDSITYITTIPSIQVGNININNNNQYTNKTGVTLNIINPDPGRYNYMSFSQDLVKWTGWETYKTTKSISLTGQDGEKWVYVRFADNTKTDISSIYGDGIILDRKKPTGTIQINGGGYITNNLDVTVETNVVDELSGIEYIEISVDNVNWVNIGNTNTANITLTTGDGVKKVYMRIRDKAGNISPTIIDTIILDTRPPVGKITISKLTTTPDPNDVKITLSASGSVWMKVSYDGGVTYGSWESYKTTKIVTLPDGKNTISVIFKDLAGNESIPISATITVP